MFQAIQKEFIETKKVFFLIFISSVYDCDEQEKSESKCNDYFYKYKVRTNFGEMENTS